MTLPEGEKEREKNRRKFWNNNDGKFYQINVRFQITIQKLKEWLAEKNACPSPYPSKMIFKLQKIKDGLKILKEARG